MELNQSYGFYNYYNDYNYDTYLEDLSISQEILFYLFIAEIILGFSGNCLSFCVMLRKQMRQTSTSIYLLTLAIFDNLVLIFGVFIGLILPSKEFLNYYLSSENKALCIFITFMELFVPPVSVWCLVLITFERILITFLPHR